MQRFVLNLFLFLFLCFHFGRIVQLEKSNQLRAIGPCSIHNDAFKRVFKISIFYETSFFSIGISIQTFQAGKQRLFIFLIF